MKKALIVARKDIRDAFQSRATYFYILFLFLLVVPYFNAFETVIKRLTEAGADAAALRQGAQAIMDTTAFTVPLVVTMLMSGIFAAYAVVVDKAKRTLESLLATPLSLRQVWMGKSLAVALPSIAISLVVSAAVIVVINLVIVRPAVGAFIIPGVRPVITALITIPLLTFLLVSLVSYLQLVMTNPRIASFAFTLVFLALYFSTITELNTRIDFSMIYLILAVILGFLALVADRFLTREKVVLSSKS